jgi:hypothetical protein
MYLSSRKGKLKSQTHLNKTCLSMYQQNSTNPIFSSTCAKDSVKEKFFQTMLNPNSETL